MIIAVLHMCGDVPLESIVDASVQQGLLARDHGADGCAVIPAGMKKGNAHLVTDVVRKLRAAWPEAFLAVNYMTTAADAMRSVPTEADALWTDKGIGPPGGSLKAGPDSGVVLTALEAKAVRDRERGDFRGMWLPGFYHKGDRGDSLPPDLGPRATELHDILCAEGAVTTGVATGIPASPSDVRRIRESLGAHTKLVLASGVQASNIASYKGLVDYFFVGTGIERRDPTLVTQYMEIYDLSEAEAREVAVRQGDIDPERLKALVHAIKQ